MTWTREGEILDSRYAALFLVNSVNTKVSFVICSWEEISPGKSRNTMKLERLDRSNLGQTLECEGNNNNHTQPVAAKIAINMNCEYLNLYLFTLTCN